MQGLTPLSLAVSFAAGPAGAGLLNTVTHAAAIAIDTAVINTLYATGFDLDETFRELGSSENVRSIVSTVATAGA